MKKMLKALAAGIIFAAALTMTACVLPGSSEGSNPLAPIGVDYMDAKLGDIILDNGHICKPDDFNKTTMKPVAIIIREVSESKCALGIALKEGSNKPWCISTAEGYKTNVSSLSQYALTDSTTAHQTLLKNVKDYSAIYYPAWGYCASYGVTNSLPLTFKVGWCLPTKDELSSLASNYNAYIPAFSKVDSSSRDLLKYGNNNLYVSCSQKDTKTSYYLDLSEKNGFSELKKIDGTSDFDSTSKNLIAHPVYHFTNNAVTIYKPVISDKSNNSVTIKCYTPGTTIYYRVDNGRLQSATTPATVPLDSSEHKITAYAAKLGCHNSATVKKTIPADGIY